MRDELPVRSVGMRQMGLGVQGTSRGVRFVLARDTAFDMCVLAVRLTDIALKSRPVFAQIVPEARECEPLRRVERPGERAG